MAVQKEKIMKFNANVCLHPKLLVTYFLVISSKLLKSMLYEYV